MEELKIVYRNIDELIPYKNNPRQNDEAVDYVANSIKEFGFKVPIIIDKDNIIVTGHTRLKAAKKLGLEQVPTIQANDLNEKQIKAFRLADNKVSDYSIWDNKKLLTELEDLEDIFTGFDISEFFNGEELDEKDNDFLEDVIDTTGEMKYTISYTCKSAEQYYDIMNYIESVKRKYEEE